MFRQYIDEARATVSATVSKYQARALVAALGLAAACFVLAAAAVLLTQAFGPVVACLILAGFFALAALVAASFAGASEKRREAIMRKMAAERPSAIASALTAAAPMALAQGASSLVRRAPIILLAVVLGGLFLRGFQGRPPARH